MFKSHRNKLLHVIFIYTRCLVVQLCARVNLIYHLTSILTEKGVGRDGKVAQAQTLMGWFGLNRSGYGF